MMMGRMSLSKEKESAGFFETLIEMAVSRK
jgi:hypothetical protein